MKAYGVPRNDDVANPDKGDGVLYGLKGFRRRSSNAKRQCRRIWKKSARRMGNSEITWSMK